MIIVGLHFVALYGGPLVARTLTYFGYVGVLTGARSRLSVSVNRRPQHDQITLIMRIRYRCHPLLVVFGLRSGISGLLRSLLFNNVQPAIEAAMSTRGETSRPLPWDLSDCS